MASFDDAGDPEVMNAFTSAIVGDHEAVRQYGIVITEATLNAQLLAMGIEKGIRGASEQEKVQRLNLIMKGTSDAQGDATRHQAGWANEMRGLRAVISDTQADRAEAPAGADAAAAWFYDFRRNSAGGCSKRFGCHHYPASVERYGEAVRLSELGHGTG